jgi:MFS transporter, PPP family, 3-phenylpropionic acid transporter
VPYWRLSSFYLFYFASLGAFIPFVGPYLKSLGFDAIAIGELLAAVMATKIIGPILMGWLADHSGQGLRLTRLASFAAALCFAGTLWRTDFFGLLFILIGFSVFWNSALPQFEVITLSCLKGNTHGYNRVRLWGSIGFIIAVIVVGQQVAELGYGIYPWLVCALLGLIWLSTLLVPAVKQEVHDEHVPILNILKQKEVMLFFCACFLLQASHAPYYTFYSIYLGSLGFDQSVQLFDWNITWVSLLWAIAVVAEVALFVVLQPILHTFNLRQVFLAALILATARWMMIAFATEELWLLILAQLLHAASFAAFHGVAIQLVHRYFVGNTQGRGQSLYGAVSFGAGGAIGAILSGYYWEKIGGSETFIWAAGVSLLAWFVAWVGLRSTLAVEKQIVI